jgi:hypothetical protein
MKVIFVLTARGPEEWPVSVLQSQKAINQLVSYAYLKPGHLERYAYPKQGGRSFVSTSPRRPNGRTRN